MTLAHIERSEGFLAQPENFLRDFFCRIFKKSEKIFFHYESCLAAKPDAPAKPKMKDVGADFVSLHWVPPENDGGAPIKGYVVERCEKGKDRWIKANKRPVPGTDFTCDNLVEMKEYLFRISAENEAGISEPSEPTEPILVREPICKSCFFHSFSLEVSSKISRRGGRSFAA